jgi:hypothetical protein
MIRPKKKGKSLKNLNNLETTGILGIEKKKTQSDTPVSSTQERNVVGQQSLMENTSRMLTDASRMTREIGPFRVTPLCGTGLKKMKPQSQCFCVEKQQESKSSSAEFVKKIMNELNEYPEFMLKLVVRLQEKMTQNVKEEIEIFRNGLPDVQEVVRHNTDVALQRVENDILQRDRQWETFSRNSELKTTQLMEHFGNLKNIIKEQIHRIDSFETGISLMAKKCHPLFLTHVGKVIDDNHDRVNSYQPMVNVALPGRCRVHKIALSFFDHDKSDSSDNDFQFQVDFKCVSFIDDEFSDVSLIKQYFLNWTIEEIDNIDETQKNCWPQQFKLESNSLKFVATKTGTIIFKDFHECSATSELTVDANKTFTVEFVNSQMALKEKHMVFQWECSSLLTCSVTRLKSPKKTKNLNDFVTMFTEIEMTGSFDENGQRLPIMQSEMPATTQIPKTESSHGRTVLGAPQMIKYERIKKQTVLLEPNDRIAPIPTGPNVRMSGKVKRDNRANEDFNQSVLSNKEQEISPNSDPSWFKTMFSDEQIAISEEDKDVTS